MYAEHRIRLITLNRSAKEAVLHTQHIRIIYSTGSNAGITSYTMYVHTRKFMRVCAFAAEDE